MTKHERIDELARAAHLTKEGSETDRRQPTTGD